MKLAIAALVCVLGGVAHADRADALFKKGKKLLAEKRYAEACTAFEDSDRLDPGIGAKLNVAKCYQEWGRLATAWRWYSDAERMAQAGKDERAIKIHALIEELDADVPRLTITVAPGTASIDVKLDDTVVAAADLGVARRVDPGPHHIAYVVAGATLSKTVPVERGGASEVVLDAPGAPPTIRPPVESPSPVALPASEPSDLGHTRRIIGIGLAAAGVVAVGVAGIVTLGARGDYQQALTDDCRGATNMCNADGLAATHAALDTANTQTVVALLGGAAIAGGITLYLLAPRAHRAEHALYLAPSVGATGGTVVLGGKF